MNILWGIMIPFLGTSLGATCVLFLRNGLNEKVKRCLVGFAAGVMVAASIWSLLIPAMEQSDSLGHMAFFPAVVGFGIGILLLLLLDKAVPQMRIVCDCPTGLGVEKKKTGMLILAVTLHNIPEGMAVGVIYAGLRSGNCGITLAGAMVLSIGIAIQNFPEGAIVSMPLYTEGYSKGKALWYGILSGAVEPVAALITVLAANTVGPILPYLLSFAAGAMMYVVVEELIPEVTADEHSYPGTIFFAVGFSLMMALDNALG